MKLRETARFGTSYTIRGMLFLSGLIASGIAATILFAPDAFYASYGIEVGGNATLANEMKAPAGALLVAGLLMFAGIVRAKFIVISLATATFVYLSYGLGRVISIAVDGMPHSGMVSAAGIEIVIGTACLLTLLYVRRVSAS